MRLFCLSCCNPDVYDTEGEATNGEAHNTSETPNKIVELSGVVHDITADDADPLAETSTSVQPTLPPDEARPHKKVAKPSLHELFEAANPVAVPDTSWRVARMPQHHGKLMWLSTQTGELSWVQPIPACTPLASAEWMHEGMRAMAMVVTQSFAGAPADPEDPHARVGISGDPPSASRLRKTCEILSVEHALYPPSLLVAARLSAIVLCENLCYNRQRRRHVPDLASGRLYIDVGDRAERRKRHSFHHELWHMIDWSVNDNAYDDVDDEWGALNPKGFKYGPGGKHMRDDSGSSQLASAPSPEFLNRYSTSAFAEDKAEVWAALMCYQWILKSEALQSKARLLMARVRQICPEMDADWWKTVQEAQRKPHDLWELHQTEHSGALRGFWHNYVTGESLWTRDDDKGERPKSARPQTRQAS